MSVSKFHGFSPHSCCKLQAISPTVCEYSLKFKRLHAGQFLIYARTNKTFCPHHRMNIAIFLNNQQNMHIIALITSL